MKNFPIVELVSWTFDSIQVCDLLALVNAINEISGKLLDASFLKSMDRFWSNFVVCTSGLSCCTATEMWHTSGISYMYYPFGRTRKYIGIKYCTTVLFSLIQ